MCKITRNPIDDLKSSKRPQVMEGKVDNFHRNIRLRCLLTILIITICIPLSVVYVAIVALVSFLIGLPKTRIIPVTNKSKIVMLTGGKMSKSLHFARWFWKNGYKVVMVETEKYRFVGSRWSRAVTYFEIATCPRVDSEKYVEDLVQIARKYDIDYFVPVSSPVSALHDSRVKPKLKELGCHVLHFDLSMTEILDDKHKFCDYASKLGLQTPTTFCVSSDSMTHDINNELNIKNNNLEIDEDDRYVLKNIEYDPKHRLDLFKLPCSSQQLEVYLQKIRADGNAITEKAPWQVQKFIHGKEYTCMAVIRDGQIRAITTSESSCSQLNYKHIEIDGITRWVEEFAKKTNITGQLCFDFMEEHKKGTIYPIECNPRVHSQCVTFLDMPEFGEAILSEAWNRKTLVPHSNSKSVFWFYNELFKALPGSFLGYRKYGEEQNGLLNFIFLLLTGRDADIDIDDPLPFFMRNHFQLPYLLMHTFRHATPWLKLDFCIGKVVELNGD